MSEVLIDPREMFRQCRCLNAQRTARRIARLYDQALRPVAVTSGQFSILAALNQPDLVPLAKLASALGLERTTLTRNLRALENRGLVSTERNETDRRLRFLRLTKAGREKLAAAMPHWRMAQSQH